jgi:TusA-related sulfurtransferase
MHNSKKQNIEPVVDVQLDITDQVCPLTFVRTKLMIERMAPGQIAEVRLKGAEPLENVPRSVREIGHTVLGLEAEDSNADDGIHILRIRKETTNRP